MSEHVAKLGNHCMFRLSTISTAANLLKSSITSSINSPVGNGPRKSDDRLLHGADGMVS